jgi:dTDP-4-amino-4,6-dideoxygalactose transaminase
MCLYVWSKKFPDRKEVIIPNYGYPAAYKACNVLGLIPIPIDIQRYTLSMNLEDLWKNLKNETLAVVHVESNGVIGNAKGIKEIIGDEHCLFIEDSAPSILQDKAGSFGDVAMFSFSPTKPFCAGEGSVIVTDNEDLYHDLKNFRYIGNYNNLTTSLNFQMSSFLAAYLLPQFDYADEIIEMRERVHNEYSKHLNIFKEHYCSTNRHGAIMFLHPKAEQISKKLSLFGIEHRYRYYPCIENLPVSNEVRNEIIDLPMHHELDENKIKIICEIIKRDF